MAFIGWVVAKFFRHDLNRIPFDDEYCRSLMQTRMSYERIVIKK